MNYSMLESAEDYAREVEMKITRPWVQDFFRLWLIKVAKDTECRCNGGLPMMKRHCPKHGHLVRSADSR